MTTASTTGLPADILEILNAIDEADRRADRLAGSLNDLQFSWQPDGGASWSVAQCLDHLATMNAVYGDAVRTGVELGRRNGWVRSGPLAPGFFGRKFIASLEPPVRRRMRAPARTRPGSTLDREEIMRRYHEAHDRLKQIVRDAALIDANRATYVNPFIRPIRMRVSTGLLIIAAHDRRHLWQADRVLERPDFPR